MKMRIDRDADVLWVQWGDITGSKAREIGKHIYLHVTEGEEPVALEVLFISRRARDSPDRVLLEYFPKGSFAENDGAIERMSIEFGAAVSP